MYVRVGGVCPVAIHSFDVESLNLGWAVKRAQRRKICGTPFAFDCRLGIWYCGPIGCRDTGWPTRIMYRKKPSGVVATSADNSY